MLSRVALLSCVLLSACAQQFQTTSPSPDAPRAILGSDRSTATGTAAPETQAVTPSGDQQQTYSPEEMSRVASEFFGETSESLAKAIERTFSDYGRPTAYILGREGGGAAVIGVRYGEGTLQYKGGGSIPVYWQGPTVGWDFGGSASKVFTLVYNLNDTYQLFQRFPAVDGSLYVIAGFSVNYQRSGDIVLAPIRTGVGLRAGASLGYIHYTRERSYIPL
ncbi:DUF1134 domain-containing protein [Sinimarinibacterium sp. CAU 1509]|uniref:DUF1134 domain-containing protein n=1 Tax=Sinimarinibacterium sp. CAU 1509 TaxID=2562283 RepID=UPI0010AD8236|nr:DUF1134 domain-containing protein [Sinimarinibacterium sp. CAU 1509]TJY59341.1 DUF1134 domain-containing protein [Sinimarinibacterium sp. CAU 1509]